jgi:hypothetical protein
MPRARGSASGIKKRLSHITVVLGPVKGEADSSAEAPTAKVRRTSKAKSQAE